jgi:hypothetical protein
VPERQLGVLGAPEVVVDATRPDEFARPERSSSAAEFTAPQDATTMSAV